MVIDIVDVQCVTIFKTKDHSPIGANFERPRVSRFDAARTVADLDVPGLRLHPLKGELWWIERIMFYCNALRNACQ